MRALFCRMLLLVAGVVLLITDHSMSLIQVPIMATGTGSATTNPVRAVAAEKTLIGTLLDDVAISAAAAKVAETIEDPQYDHAT